MASAPRLQITSSFITFFADRLRLNAYEDLGRFYVSASADGAARDGSSPVVFDLPKQDAAAFRLAIKLFNATLDEHEANIADRNDKRRRRRRLPLGQSHPDHHAIAT